LSPPLRSEADRQACLAAVKDGTIDVISSGHCPCGPEAKRLPFADAEPGASGLETLLALSLGLVRDGLIDTHRLFQMLSTNPAKILGLDCGEIAVGKPADIILYSPDVPWIIDGDAFLAAAGNTPFDKMPTQGKVQVTIKGGRLLG
jgi:dihydroorotase